MKELKKRKPTHLKEYDYGTNGAYFLTICSQDRKKIFSTIVGEGSPLPKLSSEGMIIDHLIQNFSQKYPSISIPYYVIMPNHIHLLLALDHTAGRGNPSPTVETAIGWFKYQATKEINQMNGTPGVKIFQRSFYDHIIRDLKDYELRVQYIQNNPLRWVEDELYIPN